VKSHDAIVGNFLASAIQKLKMDPHHGGFGPERFGMNEVSDGWAQGLRDEVGGRRELIVPPKLGYQGHSSDLCDRSACRGT